ncbi:MAG TPA: hypothetical protein VN408_23385 [Actinoplanes sp.]|nr:hypothetical protein [Actinoplanes sp.]
MTVTARPAPALRHFGVSIGHLTEGSADSWIRALRLPASAQACTHRADLPFPHVAVSVALPAGVASPVVMAGSAFLEAAVAAGAAHSAGRSGRAVHFRGWSLFRGAVTVGDLLHHTDVVRVTDGSRNARPDVVLDAGRGLTPHWRDGELVVLAESSPDGTLVPLPGFRV